VLLLTSLAAQGVLICLQISLHEIYYCSKAGADWACCVHFTFVV
jgi:hypothetical protein